MGQAGCSPEGMAPPWIERHVEVSPQGPGPPAKSPSAPQPQEEGVPALLAVHGVIFVIEVQDVLLRLEAKFLVQKHGGVACRDVECDILPHACLRGDRSPGLACQGAGQRFGHAIPGAFILYYYYFFFIFCYAQLLGVTRLTFHYVLYVHNCVREQ